MDWSKKNRLSKQKDGRCHVRFLTTSIIMKKYFNGGSMFYLHHQCTREQHERQRHSQWRRRLLKRHLIAFAHFLFWGSQILFIFMRKELEVNLVGNCKSKKCNIFERRIHRTLLITAPALASYYCRYLWFSQSFCKRGNAMTHIHVH